MGHEDAFPRPRLSARCRFSQRTSRGLGATSERRRSRNLGLPYRRRQSAVFRRGGAKPTADGAPAGYANARFTVAQNAQDSSRGLDTAGNLVNVDKTALGEGSFNGIRYLS